MREEADQPPVPLSPRGEQCHQRCNGQIASEVTGNAADFWISCSRVRDDGNVGQLSIKSECMEAFKESVHVFVSNSFYRPVFMISLALWAERPELPASIQSYYSEQSIQPGKRGMDSRKLKERTVLTVGFQRALLRLTWPPYSSGSMKGFSCAGGAFSECVALQFSRSSLMDALRH